MAKEKQKCEACDGDGAIYVTCWECGGEGSVSEDGDEPQGPSLRELEIMGQQRLIDQRQ